MSTGTEIVRQAAELVPLEEVERTLDDLVERGDTEALAEGRAQAEASAAYERRRGAKERADYFSRIKVMAEAAVGVIDLRQNKSHSWRSNPLVVGDKEIDLGVRQQWRTLGRGHHLGLLAKACDEVVAIKVKGSPNGGRDGLTTTSVLVELRRYGVGYVDRRALGFLVRKEACRQRLSLGEVCRRATVANGVLHHTSAMQRVSWDVAERLCKVLGVDPKQLPLAPSQKRVRSRGRLAVRPRGLRGGRWDHAYSLHRKMMEEIFAITGESGNSDLWAHLHAIEDFLKRRV